MATTMPDRDAELGSQLMPMKPDDKRKIAYAVIMGTCLALVILAWTLVRLYSVTAAIVMSVVALLLPPVAAMVANAGDEQRPRR
jgi:multisubunit Na+/H+ antiporter MnhG subunit